MKSQEEMFRYISGHCAKLMEHFDTVEIFVTKHDKEGTLSLAKGDGNWYARIGQINEWMNTGGINYLEDGEDDEE